MTTEGRIRSSPDVVGGNAVRTVEISTTASDEGAPSTKDVQVVSLGDPTTAANLAAVDASGRLTVTLPAGPTVGTITTATVTTSDTSVIAANTARLGLTVYNESGSTCYLAVSVTAASVTAYTVQIPVGGYYELPSPPGTKVYSGALRGIVASGAASAVLRVTELT